MHKALAVVLSVNPRERRKLEDKEKQAFFSIKAALLARKKLKDTLANAIGLAS